MQEPTNRYEGNTGLEDSPDALRMYEQFQKTLRDPEDTFIRGKEARAKFKLSKEDMNGLKSFTKESPYDAHAPPFQQYALVEVVALALKKHGEAALLRNFWTRLLPSMLATSQSFAARSLYGYADEHEEEQQDAAGRRKQDIPVSRQKRYWYNAPSTTTVEGRQSVLQGLRTNIGICSVKGTVWFMTGSHVVFADLMHSIADVANYSYRLTEMNRSSRQRDAFHPYGYAPLRYITADRSFVFLFFVGGICPLISGMRELAVDQVGMCDMLLAPALVFTVSAVLEAAAMQAAFREIRVQATKEKIVPDSRWPGDLGRVMAYLREGRDVMSTATFTEASSGVLGAAIGLAGLGASYYLQSGVPDVVGSIVMGVLVCMVSTFLMRKSGNALLGQTLPQWRVQELVSRLEAHPAVVNVYDVKTEMVGTDTVRFKAEVQFRPTSITERVLQAGLQHRVGELPTPSVAHFKAYQVICERLHVTLPLLNDAAAEASAREQAEGRVEAVAPWLCKNNDLFYEALVWELKDLERILRDELSDFRNVHIDIEPW